MVNKFLGMATLLAVFWGAYSHIDSTYANAEEVHALEQRVHEFITNDQIADKQRRVWTLKERFGENLERASKTTKEEYRQLLKEIEDLKDARD